MSDLALNSPIKDIPSIQICNLKLGGGPPRFSCSDVADFIDQNDEFVVFGASQGGRTLKKTLEQRDKQIVCFLDNDREKAGTIVDGRLVHHPSTFDYIDRKILIASYWTAEIATQLVRDHGQQSCRDFVPLYHYFCDVEPSASGEQAVGEPFYHYYQKHISEFSKVFELLGDERSRQILQKIVMFRCHAFEPHHLQLEDFPYQAMQFKNHLASVLCTSEKLLHRIPDAGFRYPISQALVTTPYSYLNLITPKNKEGIIDAGAFDGDTAGMFALMSPNSSVYSFEPVQRLYAKLVGLSQVLTEIKPVHAAVWDRSGQIGFQENTLTPQMSGVSDTTAACSVRATSLDDFIENDGQGKIDFVKMDIEGAELHALKGAENLIKTSKPDLAICIYHKPEHLWRIPLWLKETLPQYHIYIDHKSHGLTESVCFASVN